jgi:hypothetical protein
MQTSSAVIAALLFSATALFAQEPPPVSEVINVERIILDVRVVDTFGNPIPNLKPGDFRVRVGNKVATVVAAEWIDETKPPELPELPAEGTEGETPAIPEMQSGRILVFFFQNDFGRANMRVVGHMKVLSTIDSLIDRLQPDDRVAVFSYDSQLKFRLDLTSDKAKIRGEVSKTLAIDNPPWPAGEKARSSAHARCRNTGARAASRE